MNFSSLNTGVSGRQPRRRSTGFTLVEMLVVVAILAMIAAFAAPRALKWLGGAKTDSARVQMEAIGTGIDLYRLEVGAFPPDLEALVRKPSGNDRWNGPYLKKTSVPKDPWGNPFVYRYPGENGEYDLVSLGADGAEGGEGEASDIKSWE